MPAVDPQASANHTMTPKERILAVLNRKPVDRLPVRECIQAVGAEREGYICCSCHHVQAGTPLENIFAMVETIKNS